MKLSPISMNYSSEINQDETFNQMKTYIKNLEKKIASQQIEIESLKSLNFFLEKKKKNYQHIYL